MKMYKIIIFVFAAIVLVASGFFVGSTRTKTEAISSNMNGEVTVKDSVSKDSIPALFFSELKKSMYGYTEGNQILIKPISYKNKTAIISYPTSQESYGYTVIDFANNKIYQTKFGSSIGSEYIPILIVDENKLLATSRNEGYSDFNTELDLTDHVGNIIKVLKKFTTTNPSLDIIYDYTYSGKDIILTILGESYTLNQDYDLIPTK